MIADRIEEKENRYAEYCQGLSHVNLIVCDFEERLFSVEPSEFHKYFYTPYLKQSLIGTPFREVFLITRIDEGKRVYYPLKMVLLFSELYLFGGALESYESAPSDLSMQTSLRLFTCFMRRRGAEAYLKKKPNGEVEVFFGDSSIMANESGTNVHMYADRPWPQALRIPDTKLFEDVVGDDFLSHFKEFEKTNYFVSEIAIETNTDILFGKG